MKHIQNYSEFIFEAHQRPLKRNWKKYPGAKIMPFRQLPPEYQDAMIHYMAVDGEAWEYPEEFGPGFRPNWTSASWVKWHDKVRYWFVENFGQVRFGVVSLPLQVFIENFESLPEDDSIGGDFWEQHKDYQRTGNRRTKHDLTKPLWPVILDNGDDNYIIQDGSHRFHYYVANGITEIPCIFYP